MSTKLPGWKRHILAKVRKERSAVLEVTNGFSTDVPSDLFTYWPNVKALLVKHLVSMAEPAIEAVMSDEKSTRETANSWMAGYSYALQMVADSQLGAKNP